MFFVSSIEVSPSSKTLLVGGSVLLNATVYPTTAPCRSVTWWSSKPTVATVNPDTGLVRAQKAGTAYIYAEALDGSGVYGSCYITVTAPIRVSEVEIIKNIENEDNLKPGDTFQLTAVVRPTNATNKTVYWESSNTGIACVDYYTGYVTILGHGSVNIYATARDGGNASGLCHLVIPKPVTGISITQFGVSVASVTMSQGMTRTLTATVSPNDATDKSVTWESDNPDVATVTNGTVYGASRGTATISAYACGAEPGDEIVDSCTVNVVEINGIPEEITLYPGETFTLTPIVMLPDSLNANISYGTMDPTVATVSQSGKITAHQEGTAIISVNVSGAYRSFIVNVVRKKVVVSSVNENGEFFKKVEFFDKNDNVERTWICVEHDLIFNTSDCFELDYHKWQKFALSNCYDNYLFYAPPLAFGTFLTYSPEELRLLYAIDPYGVAFYVQQYGVEISRINSNMSSNECLLNTLNFKDEVFEILFGRAPVYYECYEYEGIVHFVKSSSNANRLNKYSEAERLFGFHRRQPSSIQWFDFAKAVTSSVLDIATDLIGGPLSVIKLAWSAFSLGEATLKGEIAGYAAEYIIQEVIDDTRINWISDIFDIYGSFVNLVDAISSTPNFTVPVVNYCADNPLYKVFIKRSNGYLEPMYSITDDE